MNKPKRNEPLTISGTWQLNRDESDDPRKKIQESRSSGRNPSGGTYGGHRGGGYPGGHGPYGGHGGNYPTGQSDEDRKRMEDLFRPARVMTIVRNDAQVDVTDDQERRRIFFTDGRKLQKPKKDEPQEEFSAKWENGRLVSEEKGSGGMKITRTFELSRDGESLYELLYLERSGESGVYVRYVYDRAEEK